MCLRNLSSVQAAATAGCSNRAVVEQQQQRGRLVDSHTTQQLPRPCCLCAVLLSLSAVWLCLQVDGVVSKGETPFYLGKRIAYIYKASTLKKNSYYRVIWGKFTRAHGNAGALRWGAGAGGSSRVWGRGREGDGEASRDEG